MLPIRRLLDFDAIPVNWTTVSERFNVFTRFFPGLAQIVLTGLRKTHSTTLIQAGFLQCSGMPRQLRVIAVKKKCTAEELLKELRLNPLVYFVVRDKRALLPEEIITEGQVVGVLPVIAGGS